jgi:hypothetical protein
MSLWPSSATSRPICDPGKAELAQTWKLGATCKSAEACKRSVSKRNSTSVSSAFISRVVFSFVVRNVTTLYRINHPELWWRKGNHLEEDSKKAARKSVSCANRQLSRCRWREAGTVRLPSRRSEQTLYGSEISIIRTVFRSRNPMQPGVNWWPSIGRLEAELRQTQSDRQGIPHVFSSAE